MPVKKFLYWHYLSILKNRGWMFTSVKRNYFLKWNLKKTNNKNMSSEVNYLFARHNNQLPDNEGSFGRGFCCMTSFVAYFFRVKFKQCGLLFCFQGSSPNWRLLPLIWLQCTHRWRRRPNSGMVPFFVVSDRLVNIESTAGLLSPPQMLLKN